MTNHEIANLLSFCEQKLRLYRDAHSGEYIGGMEYTALQRKIGAAVKELGSQTSKCLACGADLGVRVVHGHDPLCPTVENHMKTMRQKVDMDIRAYMKTAEYRRDKKLIDAYNKCIKRTGGSRECLEFLKRTAQRRDAK